MTHRSATRYSFSPFKPPFNGTAALMGCLFVAFFFLWPNNLSLRGELPDSDDYMYLAQTMDWLNGQGWYDNIQHRLNPPEGVPIHFSRFAQIPFALAILTLKAAGFASVKASIIVAIIWPPLLLLAMFAALRWTAQNFMPCEWARFTAGICLFTTPLLAQFMPGHLDHHALMQLVTMLALGCVLRMFTTPHILKWSIAAGGLLAFGQTIALETLPWLLLCSGFVALWSAWQGDTAAKAAAIFAISVLGFSLFFLLVSFPPSAWFTLNGFSFSFVYVLLAAGIAITCGGIALAADLPRTQRCLIGLLLAASGAGLFLHQFPNLLAGPYGAMDDALSKLYMSNIREAQPLTKYAPDWYGPPLILLAPLLALATALKCWHRTRAGQRWRWSLMIVLLTAAIILTVFYQMRFMSYAEAFTVIPLAVLAQHCLTIIAVWRNAILRAVARLAIILFVLANCLLLILQIGVSQDRQGIHQLTSILNDPQTLGARPRVIINMMNDGAELLFRTPHLPLAAPYNNLSGNRDDLQFFFTHDPAEAERIARDRKADLVLLNHTLPAASDTEQSDICLITPASQMNFARQLASGIIPPWLKPVPLPEAIPYWMFEVQPSATP